MAAVVAGTEADTGAEAGTGENSGLSNQSYLIYIFSDVAPIPMKNVITNHYGKICKMH